MRYYILFSIFLCVLFFGCKKLKINSVPAVKYKSANTTELHQGETLIMNIEFSDKEADFTDTSFVVVKTVQKTANPCFDPPGSTSGFVQPYPLGIPSGIKEGTIVVTYGYNDISPKCTNVNDTTIFKFVLKDAAGHVSDTATSEQIIIYR
ncbi:hypothetical protein BH09BAC2_BH09BAC2_14070 [soil metagenome]